MNYQDQIYDSKEIEEWCKEFGKTQEEYYETKRMVWNMFANIGGRQLK